MTSGSSIFHFHSVPTGLEWCLAERGARGRGREGGRERGREWEGVGGGEGVRGRGSEGERE